LLIITSQVPVDRWHDIVGNPEVSRRRQCTLDRDVTQCLTRELLGDNSSSNGDRWQPLPSTWASRAPAFTGCWTRLARHDLTTPPAGSSRSGSGAARSSWREQTISENYMWKPHGKGQRCCSPAYVVSDSGLDAALA
jgi:hypothetical protein